MPAHASLRQPFALRLNTKIGNHGCLPKKQITATSIEDLVSGRLDDFIGCIAGSRARLLLAGFAFFKFNKNTTLTSTRSSGTTRSQGPRSGNLTGAKPSDDGSRRAHVGRADQGLSGEDRALNKRGPGLNASPNSTRWLEEAAKADRERSQGIVRGPAHGLPILLKDLIDVKGMYTSAGNYSLRDSFPERLGRGGEAARAAAS